MSGKRVVVNLNAISFEEWMKLETARTAKAWQIAGKAITDWDYDVPVSDGLRALPTANDANYVSAFVVKQMQKTLEDEEGAGVVVDLVWTPDEWLQFQEDCTLSNWRAVERALHQVASIRGVDKEQPLTALQGMRMFAAVRERYKDAMSGNF